MKHKFNTRAKLNFNIDAEYIPAINALSEKLGFEISDGGTRVSAECGDRIGVCLKDGEATLYFNKKHQLFRELGLLCEALKVGKTSLDITEDGHFETVSAMIDASRCAVPTVETAKELIEAGAERLGTSSGAVILEGNK